MEIMKTLFNPSGAATTETTDVPKEVNPTTEPVEAKDGGSEVQQEQERTYTAADMQAIVKERLAREQKKYEKLLAEAEKKVTVAPKVASNTDDEWRTKMADYEAKAAVLTEQVTKYRSESLTATIERSLNQHGCLDPEVVIDHFKSRNLVHLDDDGNVVVENDSGRLDDLVKDYLAKKPHLVKAQTVTGVGSKAPKSQSGSMSRKEELEALLAVPPKQGLFQR